MASRFIDGRKGATPPHAGDPLKSHTHNDLILAGCYLLEKKRLPYWTYWKPKENEELKLIEYNTPKMHIILPEMFTWGNRPDVMGYHLMGFSVCLECKVSRSDFMRDKHKTNDHPGDIVYYLTIPGIIDMNRDKERLGDKGVIEWDGSQFFVKRLPTTEKEYNELYRNIEVGILVRVLMYEKIMGVKDYRGFTKKSPAPTRIA